MNTYTVMVGGVPFGASSYKANSESELRKRIVEQIDNLHPINSSNKSAKQYRKRFQNKAIEIKLIY